MSFANTARNLNSNRTTTTNGMAAFKSSGSAVLDLYNAIGSARGTNIDHLFEAAYKEDADLTMRVALWSRDIIQGAGERQIFRNFITWLEKVDPNAATRLIPKVPELGRWDDMFSFTYPDNRAMAFAEISSALDSGNGLAAKWMPRKGSVAAELTKFLGLTPRQYRKKLVSLTNVVETLMAGKAWDKINFSHVPSMASSRYQKAFGRNAPEKYGAYLAELKKPVADRSDPKVKINAKAIMPYEVIRNLWSGNEDAANAQWDALPNLVGDANIMAIVDTSGSMGSMRHNQSWYFSAPTGAPQPIEVSVSLGLYTADKNTGAFADLMMIFDTVPRLVDFSGDKNLSEKIRKIPEVVAGSTNIEAAFDMILDIAKKGKVPQHEMPETLLILSDMQLNQAVRNHTYTVQETKERKYRMDGN